MVKRYLQFCEEEQFEPLSHATLFRVLEVKEASQQKSLSGLDNIAADGSAWFERLDRIVDELSQIGLKKGIADELRTEYQSYCQDDGVNAPTTAVSLSDPKNPDFQETMYTNIRFAALNVTTLFCVRSQEQQYDFLYDIEKSSEAIVHWKTDLWIRNKRSKISSQSLTRAHVFSSWIGPWSSCSYAIERKKVTRTEKEVSVGISAA